MRNKRWGLKALLGLLLMLMIGAVPAFASNGREIIVGTELTMNADLNPMDDVWYFYFTLNKPAKVRISGSINTPWYAGLDSLDVYVDEDTYYSPQTVAVQWSGGICKRPWKEVVLNKGRHYLRVNSSHIREYVVSVDIVKTYQEGPATAITLPKKATVTKGIKYQLKPTLVNSYEKLTGMKWSTSKKSVATVNSKGVITPKKKGTCNIICKLKNGKKYTCKVTVKDNVYNGKSYSKIRVNDYRYGQVWLEPTKISYSGKNLKVECAAVNNRMFKAKYFNWIKLTVYNGDAKVIATKKFGKTTLNIGEYGKKKISFTFPSSSVKKKSYDLRTDKGIYIIYDYYYTWQY